MKIGIIGMGYVGRAVAASWLGSQHVVKFYDPAVAGSTDNINDIVADRPGALLLLKVQYHQNFGKVIPSTVIYFMFRNF